MKRFLQRCLKAGLIGLMCIPTLLWAADSPRVTVDQSPIGANKADIHFDSLINGDNHMDIVITSGSPPGCSAGMYWDIRVGGCSSALKLRTESTSRACDCSCSGKGSCTASQSGKYDVFGWQLPTDGHELISYNGPTTWAACQVVSNGCEDGDGSSGGGGGDTGGDTDTGTAPAPGTVLYITAYICDASNPDFSSGPLDDSQKAQIITAYRQFSSGARCPELAGYVFWQNATIGYAQNYLSSNPGTSYADAIAIVFNKTTYPAMNEAAASNNEGDSAHLAVLDAYCSSYASDKYGVPISATYVFGSGSSCIVN